MTRSKAAAAKKASATTETPEAAPTTPAVTPEPAPEPAPVEASTPTPEPVAEPAPSEPEAVEPEPAEDPEKAELREQIAALQGSLAEAVEALRTAAAPTPESTPAPFTPVVPEAQFGADPGDAPTSEADAVGGRVEAPERPEESQGRVPLLYLGVKGGAEPHPTPIQIIVPVSPTEADYQALITEGTVYTFRTGRATHVKPEHREWLEGYPAYVIERP